FRQWLWCRHCDDTGCRLLTTGGASKVFGPVAAIIRCRNAQRSPVDLGGHGYLFPGLWYLGYCWPGVGRCGNICPHLTPRSRPGSPARRLGEVGDHYAIDFGVTNHLVAFIDLAEFDFP